MAAKLLDLFLNNNGTRINTDSTDLVASLMVFIRALKITSVNWEQVYC